MSQELIEEITPAQKHIAARMLARAETLLLDPNAPYRDQLMEMYANEDGTPQAEFRRMLSHYAGVRDEWIMDRVEEDLTLAFALDAQDVPGFSDLSPRLSDAGFQKRYESFREFLFGLAVNDAQNAHSSSVIH